MAGMWIVHVDVGDDEEYAEYIEGSTRVVPAYDGVFMARGGRYEQKEGRAYARNVVVRFPTYDRALECYQSDEYQAIVGKAKASSDRMFTILEVDD